jgi:hypothetical protein
MASGHGHLSQDLVALSDGESLVVVLVVTDVEERFARGGDAEAGEQDFLLDGEVVGVAHSSIIAGDRRAVKSFLKPRSDNTSPQLDTTGRSHSFEFTLVPMTSDCDPDLVANPTVIDDPLSDDDVPGQILSWQCCGTEWYLSPATRQEPQRTHAAWHMASRVLSDYS